MPLHGQREILRIHSTPVVDDADEFASPCFKRNVDPCGSCIQGVLDKLLDSRCRTFDHFTRSDAVNQDGIEAADWHGAFLPGGESARKFHRILHPHGASGCSNEQFLAIEQALGDALDVVKRHGRD